MVFTYIPVLSYYGTRVPVASVTIVLEYYSYTSSTRVPLVLQYRVHVLVRVPGTRTRVLEYTCTTMVLEYVYLTSSFPRY